MKLGLYTHIPFCQAKCGYCHFVSIPFEKTLASRYADAVVREIAIAHSIDGDCIEADSIYFGGGTPSLIPSDSVSRILATFRNRLQISHECEISLEANPGTLSKEKLDDFQRFGINRISLGVQTFADRELAAIGRLHSSSMIHSALADLKAAGFTNVSLDLMLGLPLQTRDSWKVNLTNAARLGIPHISIYMLDLDDPCPLAELVARGAVTIPSDDLVSDLYLETIEFLSSCGYQQYEISNFALPGYTCLHNLKYWRRDPVIGFGLASHSFNGSDRWANKARISDYLNAIETGTSAEEWRETVGKTQALQETLFLGMRMTGGINWDELARRYDGGTLTKYLDYIRSLSSQNLIKMEDGRISLSPSGMLLSNEIFQYFV